MCVWEEGSEKERVGFQAVFARKFLILFAAPPYGQCAGLGKEDLCFLGDQVRNTQRVHP